MNVRPIAAVTIDELYVISSRIVDNKTPGRNAEKALKLPVRCRPNIIV